MNSMLQPIFKYYKRVEDRKINTQTATDRWSEEKIERNRISIKGRIFDFLNQRILSIIGLKVVRNNSQVSDNKFNNFRLLEPGVIQARNNRISEVLVNFFTELEIETDAEEVTKYTQEFDKILLSSPIQNMDGGFSYNNALTLFIFVRLTNPKSVIESGVWRGFTTYIIRSGAPSSSIQCFDINLENLVYVDTAAAYHEYDLTKWDYNEIELLFCDDHVPQDSRLSWASALKIPLLVFDDDLTDFEIHSDGWPAFPTIAQILSAGNEEKTLTWLYDGKTRTGKYSGARFINILDEYNYCRAPLLFELTGYVDRSRTSFLTLKSKIK
jgi:hypothetical protein